MQRREFNKLAVGALLLPAIPVSEAQSHAWHGTYTSPQILTFSYSEPQDSDINYDLEYELKDGILTVVATAKTRDYHSSICPIIYVEYTWDGEAPDNIDEVLRKIRANPHEAARELSKCCNDLAMFSNDCKCSQYNIVFSGKRDFLKMKTVTYYFNETQRKTKDDHNN